MFSSKAIDAAIALLDSDNCDATVDILNGYTAREIHEVADVLRADGADALADEIEELSQDA